VTADFTAVLLVGGKGTRLQTVVSTVPKPMAPVAGKPFLEYLVAQVAALGAREVILCVSHLRQVIQDHFGDGARWGVRISYSVEDQPLGTGGAIAAAFDRFKGNTALVLNGDTYCVFDPVRLWRKHTSVNSRCTIGVMCVPDAARYGKVIFDQDGRVERFVEKGSAGEAWVNCGVYLVELSSLTDMPASRPCSFEEQGCPALIGKGLYACEMSGPFIDIGTPASFVEAQELLPRLQRGGPAS